MLNKTFKVFLGKSTLRFYRFFGFKELLKLILSRVFKFKYNAVFSEMKIKFRPYVKSDFSGFMQFMRFSDNNYLHSIYSRVVTDKNSFKFYFFDLGANIGLDSLNFYKLFNSSNWISAVEMDTENFEILKLNLKQFDSSRLNLINKAVWTVSDENISYSKDTEPNAYKIEEKIGIVKLNERFIKTISMSELLKLAEGFEGKIILKMDIEGAEKEIFKLQELEWLHNLDFIYLEYHFFSDSEILELVEKLSHYGLLVIDKFNYWDTPGWGGLLFEKDNLS
jgi:FkbM family methyltransferase